MILQLCYYSNLSIPERFIMSIQTRLLKQRYSELNLRTPTNQELLDGGLPQVRFKTLSQDKVSKFTNILKYPKYRDKYYSGYSSLINDYFMEVSMTAAKRGSSKAIPFLYNQHLVRKLAYFIKYKSYYSNSFDHYGITWTFNLLMAMRSFIMRQRIERKELPPIWNKHNFAATKGYYDTVKPMGNRAMRDIAYQLYDLCYDDTLLYMSKVDLR